MSIYSINALPFAAAILPAITPTNLRYLIMAEGTGSLSEEMRELIQTSVREVLPSLLEDALASASRSPGTAGGEPSSRDTDGKHSYPTVLLQLTQNIDRLSKPTSSLIKFWGSVRMGRGGGNLTGIIISPPCQSVLIKNEWH